MLSVCKSGYVQHEKEVRLGLELWADLISWCYFVSGGGRLTSHIPAGSHPVRTDLTYTVLRSANVKTARCVWPQLSSVHQKEITHLSISPSLHITRLCPVFFILRAREMIDEYRVQEYLPYLSSGARYHHNKRIEIEKWQARPDQHGRDFINN